MCLFPIRLPSLRSCMPMTDLISVAQNGLCGWLGDVTAAIESSAVSSVHLADQIFYCVQQLYF